MIKVVFVISAFINYYTPLPLNRANKQARKQANNKQHFSIFILAITLCQRFGLYSTLAILEPRCWPCQIQVLSQKKKSPVAPRGGGAKSGGALSKLRILCPKTCCFWPKTAAKLSQNGQTKGNGCYIARAPPLPHDNKPFLAL